MLFVGAAVHEQLLEGESSDSCNGVEAGQGEGTDGKRDDGVACKGGDACLGQEPCNGHGEYLRRGAAGKRTVGKYRSGADEGDDGNQ
ncbi:hypothetical protein SDC9_66772 [bioreactor metagenome]|uniref:Uncharacterized protein n=1 Tax=bioreactor metagenome TaxID=1076179 RepID=A0A644Y1D5_9ZZZZ